MAMIKVLPLEMREDSEILSEMDKVLNQLVLAKQIVNGAVDKFTLLVSGMRYDEEHAVNVIADFNEVFGKLFLEATLRNLDCSVQIKLFRNIIGRDKKVQRSLLQIAGIE